MTEQNQVRTAVVWFEIAVSDLAKSTAFYESVVDTSLDLQDIGFGPIAIFPHANGGIGGHIYPNAELAGQSGSIVHLNLDGPLEEALDRVTAAGGTVDGDIAPLPDGRFAYCRDLDQNRFGLFSTT